MPDTSDDRSPEDIVRLGQPQGFEIFEGNDARPYLGTPSVVEDLVREFGGLITDINGKFESGALSGPDSEAEMDALLDRYTAIFTGADEGYQPMPHVNTPAGLGALVLARMELGVPPEEAVRICLKVFIGMVVTVADKYSAGDLSDDDAQFHLFAAVDDVASALLGLPPGVNISGPIEDDAED